MKRVYFIKPIGMDGPIKIGCSQSPDCRRATLANWSPFALEIIAEIDGDFDLERRFHALFAETHQRREWFGWSKRLATTIAAINNGSFDTSALPAPINVVSNPRRGSRAHEWTPERRFLAGYDCRRRALLKAGVHRDELPFLMYLDRKEIAQLPQLAADAVAKANAVAARVRPDLKPLPLPPFAAPADQQAAA